VQVAPGAQDLCVGPEQLRSMKWVQGQGLGMASWDPAKDFLANSSHGNTTADIRYRVNHCLKIKEIFFYFEHRFLPVKKHT